MKRHNIFLAETDFARAQLVANKRGITASELIRVALTKYLDALERAQAAAKGQNQAAKP
jgi:hypothetical protein